MVKDVPEFAFYNYCDSFGDTFWPNHTLSSSKSSATPKEFPFHIVDGKNSPNLGYGLARPRIFKDLSKRLLLIHNLNFFPMHISGLEKLHQSFENFIFSLLTKNGSQKEKRVGTRISLRFAEQRDRKRTAAGIFDEPIPTDFANPVLRPKKIRKAEKRNQRTRGDAWIEGWGS